MSTTAAPPLAHSLSESSRLSELEHQIEHLAHYLPSQGPITVFVHHNTLHSLEELPFTQAVREGLSKFHSQPYFYERRYREELSRGRIRCCDLEAVLRDDLEERADESLGFVGTRFQLRMAMLEHPLLTGSDAEIEWLVAEAGVQQRYRKEAAPNAKHEALSAIQQWLSSEERSNGDPAAARVREILSTEVSRQPLDQWTELQWEAGLLHLVWQACRDGVSGLAPSNGDPVSAIRHAELLQLAKGVPVDQPVHELLIQFCAVFLDQGLARWAHPFRERGFFAAFSEQFQHSLPATAWLQPLPRELQRMRGAGLSPLESIAESLRLLGVGVEEQEEYLQRTLLALGGWAGMLWQMETNAEWTVRPAPAGTLVEFLAVRLLLDRLSAQFVARQVGLSGDLSILREQLRAELPAAPGHSPKQRAYTLFQLAQVRGWSPVDLWRLSQDGWRQLIHEVEDFSELERRRIYHLAYERRYRVQVLDAFTHHAPRRPAGNVRSFQIITCIDDREESFRRHLEEIDPACETFGAPGFFAVPIYYQGAAEAHYRPLCPIVMKPQHWVREEAAYSLSSSSRQRSATRRRIGAATHQWHLQSRTFIGGMVTAIFGSLASIPMVTRILFPRATSQFRRLFGSWLQPPRVTELRIERMEDPAGPDAGHLGFSPAEMAGAVERVLRDIGLTRGFADVILLVGHGSGSLNNPHESAYNCGACSGGRGGPNARSFAWMANQPGVRQQLRDRGLDIPDATHFVGGYHNTCDEDVTFFDLDLIPWSHRKKFEAARDVIDAARGRNAHERSRRFESARLDLSPEQALEHVQTRAEDLSQVRPEYNHATNAVCVVGRRCRTRGLFMDRRSFLQDYDPTQDDEQGTILARILAAAVPVCAGISLEYYFSCVDDVGYGCGSKLPHNITSLLGVMEGAASDLRPGLSRQMTEIHEPVRILFVIETTPEVMLGIMERNPVVGRLINNDWVQLSLLDPHSQRIKFLHRGRFTDYQPEETALPIASSSRQWYFGRRDHLPFAEIQETQRPAGAGGAA